MSASRVRGIVRRAVSRAGPSALVLTYHRVASLVSDPQLLAVTPESFAAQISMLSERFRVTSLAQLVSELASRSLEHNTVAITFDDGYADNLTHALPVLESHGTHATVFVSSGHLTQAREFWWDELERMILIPRLVPSEIVVEVEGARFAMTPGESPGDDGDTHVTDQWNVLQPDTSWRHTAYRELCGLLRPLRAADREEALAQLRSCFGLDPLVRPSHRSLMPSEVATLDTSTCVEVGSHSVHHEVLALRNRSEQRQSIIGDRDVLGDLCGRKIRSFAYPYGERSDYTGQTVRIVRDAGFEAACVNHPGLVKPWTDVLRIPRYVVRDWTAAELLQRMEEWLGHSRVPDAT